MTTHRAWHWAAGVAALATACALGIALGAVSISPSQLVRALAGAADPSSNSIVLTLRLPRVLLGALVGCGLGTSGATLQSTLRNPLAEPYLLGVSGGAAVGAVLAMTFHLNATLWPLAAFAGAALAVTLAVAVARGAGGSMRGDARVLLMAGVIVGAFANAVIMIILANVPANTVRGALWWMMGSVADASWSTVAWLAAYVFAGFAYLLAKAGDVDVLTLGDETAASIGVEVERTTRGVFLGSALVAAATVAAAGLVGFVGLVVPHIVRASGLTRQRDLLIGSALVGATLVVGADLIGRTILRPLELPLGAVTAVLGVPFFLVQLRRLA